MAELVVEGRAVRLRLGRWESFGAMRGDLLVAASQLVSARAVPDAWAEIRGIRAPGTGLPGVLALGTWRGSFGRDLVSVHGHRPGVVVELSGAAYARLVVSCGSLAEAEATVARLTAVSGDHG